MPRSRSGALVPLLAVPVLAVATPGTDGPLGPLLGLVAVAAWAGTGWLLLLLALTWGSRAPGLLGSTAAAAVRWAAPRSVRALVAAAVGTTLLVSAPGASAEDRTPTVAGSAHDSLEWPGLAPVTAPDPTPDPTPGPTSRPSPRATASAVHREPAAVPPARSVVVVAPGDSLWSIAQRSLGTGATDRQVARAWPRWWSTNRAVIGDAPDLIHPGDRLTAP